MRCSSICPARVPKAGGSCAITVMPGSSRAPSGMSSNPTCAMACPAPRGAQREPGPDRQQVLRGEDGLRARVRPDQVTRCLFGQAFRLDVVADEPLVRLDAARPEGIQVSAVALGGRVDAPEVAEKPDPGVPGVQQVGHGALSAAEVVAEHGVRGHREGGPVGEHHPGSPAHLRQQVPVIGAARHDDQPVHPPRAEGTKQRPLAGGVAVGARGQDVTIHRRPKRRPASRPTPTALLPPGRRAAGGYVQ